MSVAAYVGHAAERDIVQACRKSFEAVGRVARKRVAACLLMGIVAVSIRLAALPFFPLPYPRIHDEFSYLLASDTFAQGRLTNPSHPMWIHFETFHENFQPTYMSKYPPAQGLFLAFGQKFLGHPAFGVMISFGVMCGCLCWMLQGWMPPVYAVLGTLAAMGQLGIFGYWMNSYWGGAVAATGGCLVLGALPRLARSGGVAPAILGSLGLVLLANSRPYEGLALSAAATAALILWRRRTRSRRSFVPVVSRQVLIPFFVVCGTAALAMGYYNYRLTGDALLLPYILNDRTYAAAPPLYFLQPPNPPPTYRTEVLRKLWMEWYAPYYYHTRKNPLRVVFGNQGFIEMSRFYCSTLLVFAVLIGALLTNSRKVKLALLILAVFCCALWLEVMLFPHYAAPAAGILFIPALYGVRLLRVKAKSVGPALVFLFVGVHFALGLADGLKNFQQRIISPREEIEQNLLSRTGQHLVLVRYSRSHDPHDEFVFNRANIDGSPIVWARDLGDAANRELIDYYPSRQVWLLAPDADPRSIAPYSASGAVR